MVAACNADLATTKALRLANEVDRDGERTIGKWINCNVHQELNNHQ